MLHDIVGLVKKGTLTNQRWASAMCPFETLIGSDICAFGVPDRFARVADEISLTQSTHQIAASKSSGR